MTRTRRSGAWLGRLLLVAAIALPSACAPDGPATSRLDRAIARASAGLFAMQAPAGEWGGVATFITPDRPDAYAFTSTYVLLLDRLNVDSDNRQRAVRYLIDSQFPDGGWGEVSANFAGVLALRRSGFDETSEPIRRARAAMRRRGDVLDGASGIVKTFYAVHGLYPWSRLPLIEGVSLSGAPRADSARTMPFAKDIGASLAILKALGSGTPLTPADARTLKHAEWLLLSRQLPTGSWFEYHGFTVLAALALNELAYRPDSPPLMRARSYLRSLQLPTGLSIGFAMPITETALALLSLDSAGHSVDDPRIRRAMQYLVDSRMPGGGWGYTPALRVESDWDDLALVLAALGPTLPTVATSVETYAFSVQNADGGWATYGRDVDPAHAFVRSVPLTDEARLTWDPSLPDVTGHMLLALGRRGFRVSDPRVQKARDYLTRVQLDDGSWFGYWGVAYLYGTSQVLTGLGAIGVPPDAPDVVRAVSWLKAAQRTDGCWGEALGSSAGPAGGPAACSAAQTAWGLLGLLAGGEPPASPAVERAVHWLLEHQRDDGGWHIDPLGFALTLEYSMPTDGLTSALWALASYRDAVHRMRGQRS